jgi:hypothetical protein
LRLPSRPRRRHWWVRLYRRLLHRSAPQRRLARSHDSEEPWPGRGSARDHRQDRGQRGAIEFAAADLNSDAGLANAVAGADYVLHVASPVPTVDRKRCEDSIASSGSATRASYVPRANLVGIQNWRRASTTVGISRHGTVTRTEFGSANLQFPVRAQAAVAARHVRNASSRRTRSVWRDVRWRWTLNVLWTAA